MPITKHRKAQKGLPKRMSNPIRKAKYANYLFKATCRVCNIVFRTPAFKKHHDSSGHQSRVGTNKNKHVAVRPLF
jgi:hypothetical protein